MGTFASKEDYDTGRKAWKLQKLWELHKWRLDHGIEGEADDNDQAKPDEKPAEEPVEEFITGEILLGSRTAKDPADVMYQFDQSRRRTEQL